MINAILNSSVSEGNNNAESTIQNENSYECPRINIDIILLVVCAVPKLAFSSFFHILSNFIRHVVGAKATAKVTHDSKRPEKVATGQLEREPLALCLALLRNHDCT